MEEVKHRRDRQAFTMDAGMTETEASFPCGLLGLPSSSAYQSFFNVGVWSNRDAFKREVINPHVGKSPKPFDFEFAFRERLVIEPVSWRIGKAKLPAEDSFAK